MAEILPLSMRPNKLSDMVGMDKLVHRIRGHFATKRIPKAWMFIGPKGCGKTTLARILSLMFQCTHQKVIGDPCDACWAKEAEFNNTEIPAAKFTKKDELEQMLESSEYVPSPGSRRRVFTLDELQAASDASKDLLLKYFEDSPATTKWIICTTDPSALKETLRSRCMIYSVPGLDEMGVRVLVKKALKHVGSDRESGALIDAFLEAKVDSPRLILVGVEKYLAGCTPEEAALVEVSTEFDVNSLLGCLRKGDWAKVAYHLREAKPVDVRGIRNYLAVALNGILLDETDFTKRTRLVAESIEALSRNYGDDKMALASLSAILYKVCRGFRLYKR